MAITVRSILEDRVRRLLRDIDEGGLQWLDAELLAWFNEALAEVTRIRPEANSKTETVDLVAGALQTIPQGGSRLLEVICNMPNGIEGRSVLRFKRAELDMEDRNWMRSTSSNEIYRYAESLTDPRTFYVYPPSSGNATESKLRIVYGIPPTPLAYDSGASITASLDSDFSLPEEYSAVVANYVLYRSFAKLTESADMQRRAADYYNIFRSQMGETQQSMEQNNASTRDPMRLEG